MSNYTEICIGCGRPIGKKSDTTISNADIENYCFDPSICYSEENLVNRIVELTNARDEARALVEEIRQAVSKISNCYWRDHDTIEIELPSKQYAVLASLIMKKLPWKQENKNA